MDMHVVCGGLIPPQIIRCMSFFAPLWGLLALAKSLNSCSPCHRSTGKNLDAKVEYGPLIIYKRNWFKIYTRNGEEVNHRITRHSIRDALALFNAWSFIYLYTYFKKVKFFGYQELKNPWKRVKPRKTSYDITSHTRPRVSGEYWF